MRNHRRVQVVVPDAVLAPLVDGAVNRDAKAWQQLLAVTYPGILAVAGRWDVTGRLSTSEDDGHNIFLAVVERLLVRAATKALRRRFNPGEEPPADL